MPKVRQCLRGGTMPLGGGKRQKHGSSRGGPHRGASGGNTCKDVLTFTHEPRATELSRAKAASPLPPCRCGQAPTKQLPHARRRTAHHTFVPQCACVRAPYQNTPLAPPFLIIPMSFLMCVSLNQNISPPSQSNPLVLSYVRGRSPIHNTFLDLPHIISPQGSLRVSPPKIWSLPLALPNGPCVPR